MSKVINNVVHTPCCWPRASVGAGRPARVRSPAPRRGARPAARAAGRRARAPAPPARAAWPRAAAPAPPPTPSAWRASRVPSSRTPGNISENIVFTKHGGMDRLQHGKCHITYVKNLNQS